MNKERIKLNQSDSQLENLKEQILNIISDKKAFDVEIINVSELTTIADYIIIAEGNTTRHIKSIADAVLVILKKQNIMPLAFEGFDDDTGWIAIDYAGIILHILTEEKRKKFKLEDFWKYEIKKIKKEVEKI